MGVATAFVLPWQVSVLAGWDTAAGVFLAWVWGSVIRLRSEETAAVATIEDPSRAVVDLILVGSSSACHVGVGFTLIKASQSQGLIAAGLVALAVASVVISWGVVHTVFMLRYARLYYGHPVGGIDFNDNANPDFYDFAYLAFTIGMTYQVSDTDLTDRPIRRTALRHALLSFLFGTFIVAVTINVVAGLLK
ncbi:MAG TPA: DUF1345 domain-containing protein [Acidimicrobiia bacterium]|nr:DUF1345 domain-containing protein [Acidimicrobiia bacterium]